MSERVEEHVFGKYQLLAELGHGGMADVFLAVSEGAAGVQKLGVVKRLRENLVDEPEFVAMLLDEARLAARLNHPNVVQTNEVGQVGKQYFIAMEYLDGQALNRIHYRAAKREALSLSHHVRILADVLAGLHHAHELTEFDGTPLGVVHRDVSPQNVFVTYEGQVKVVDFGIAKAVGSSHETTAGIVKGKVTYMAPEQALGFPVDRRADVFSVGVMLWEAASKKRMWSGVQDLVIVSRLMSGDIPRSPRAVNPEVPERIDAICQKALAKNPDERHATAAELQAELETWLKDEGEHVGARSLGAIVSELFADRRAEMKPLIEKQLAALRSSATPSLAGRVELVSLAEIDPPSTSTSSLAPDTLASDAPVSKRPRVASDERAAEETGPARRRSRLGLGALAIAAAACVVGYAALRRAPPGRSTASIAPVSMPHAAVAKADERVTITLRATPAEARFRIDDGAAIDNPSMATFPKDAAPHRVRIEAPGHASETRTITFDHDAVVDVTLTADAPASSAKPTYVAPRVAAPPTEKHTPPTPPTAKPKRQIDTSDPW
jgi:serine/threonine-protein kinase